MPDIAMCLNDKCTKKHECYRYSATPGRTQDYMFFGLEETYPCGEFWPLEYKEKKAKKHGRN